MQLYRKIWLSERKKNPNMANTRKFFKYFCHKILDQNGIKIKYSSMRQTYDIFNETYLENLVQKHNDKRTDLHSTYFNQRKRRKFEGGLELIIGSKKLLGFLG